MQTYNELSKTVILKWAAVFAPISLKLAKSWAEVSQEHEWVITAVTMSNMQQSHDHSGTATIIMGDGTTLRFVKEGNGVVMHSSPYPGQPQWLNYSSVTNAVLEIGVAFCAAGFAWEFGPDEPEPPSLRQMAEAVGQAIAEYSCSLTFMSCDEPDELGNIGFHFKLDNWPIPFSLSPHAIRTAYFGPGYAKV